MNDVAWKNRIGAIALAVCLAAAVDGCSTGVHDAARTAQTAEAIVRGTVLDAASGEALGGIHVDGPHDTHAVSDRNGRFELDGLHAGDEGLVVAKTPDGRTGSVKLRKLEAGALEVVLNVGKPARR